MFAKNRIVGNHNAAYEFRVHFPEGAPYAGTLRFYGARISMSRHIRYAGS